MLLVLAVLLTTVGLVFLVPPALVLASTRVTPRALPAWVLASFSLSWGGYALFLAMTRARA